MSSGVSSPLAARGVQLALEIVEGDLPDDRVDHVLDLAREQHLALGIGLGACQHLAEGQHLAEDAGRLRERQRRARQKLPLTGGQTLVHAMAQFMGERHHVPRFAEVVQHHVGMHVRHRGMGEGAGGLALLDARVDPAIGEEGLGQFGHLRVEPGIGLRHHGARLVPRHDAGFLHRQGALRSQTCSVSSPSHFAFSA
jgi:hypothetical protein